MDRDNTVRVGDVGGWIFWKLTEHTFGGEYANRPLYSFTTSTVGNAHNPRVTEWYGSIDHAMAAAIAEKHTGARGAGGNGVGTAADWFMRMIGADQTEEKPIPVSNVPDLNLCVAECPATDHVHQRFIPVLKAGSEHWT